MLLDILPSWFEQTQLPISAKDATNSNFLMLQDASRATAAPKVA
jgi:hypothetical protein